MKRNILLVFSILILFVFSTFTAQAISRTLIPSDDTYTYSDNTIRGLEPLLKTYHSSSGAQFRRIAFLKFDISSLSPFAQSAKLRLYCNGFAAGGDNIHEFDLYPVTNNNWSEDDITYLNFVEKAGADVASPLLASYTVAAGAALSAGYVEFSNTNLLKYISDSLAAGKRYISFRLREKTPVKVGTTAVIVEFHSKENESGFTPQLVVDEKDVEPLKAADIKVNGKTITGFSESKYRNVVLLPWNETNIPTVTATAKYPDATLSITQATSLAGNEAQRTSKVSIQKGTDILTYSVVFELLPPPTDARLSGVSIDGKALEFFEMNKETYQVYLPYSASTVPVITVEPSDPNATTQIVNATSIIASDSELSRTTIINVKSANEAATKTYKVLFTQLPELDIVLAIGQSNMAGRAPFGDVMAPVEDVFLLTPGGEMEVASNPMNKYSNVRKDLSIQGLSPAYTCATTLKATVKKPIGFVVNAQGGSAMSTWYQAGKSNYDASLMRAKDAQRFGKIRVIIWHQGESDISAGLADNYVSYKANLVKLVQNFRTALNEPELFFVVGELSQNPDRVNFNTYVVLDVKSYITNSDFALTAGTSLLPDGIHFDEPSAKLLGERYAEKIIQGVYSNTDTKTVKKNESPIYIQEGNKLKIQNRELAGQLRISDLMGRVVLEQKIGSNEITFLTLQKGMYIVSFNNQKATENVATKIIIH